MRQNNGYLHPKGMRLPIFIFIIFALLIGTRAWACTCSSIPGFDYFVYNAALIVVELEVLEKLPEPVVATSVPSELNSPAPPKPPMPPRYHEDFRIKPLRLFKGDIENVNLLRTLNRNSSCYWAPEPGDRFLLYVERIVTDDEASYLIISDACQRHLSPAYEYYQSETAALQQLQAAANGPFVIEDPAVGNRPLLKGRFRKGKPVGRWSVYDLYDPSNSEPLVQFRMRSERMSKMRWTKKKLLSASQHYVVSWRYRNLGL